MPRDCPKCGKTLTRIPRKPRMRRISGSKYYECRRCGYVFLLIFNRWLLRRKQTSQRAAGSRGS